MDLFSDDRGSFGLEMDMPGWLQEKNGPCLWVPVMKGSCGGVPKL